MAKKKLLSELIENGQMNQTLAYQFGVVLPNTNMRVVQSEHLQSKSFEEILFDNNEIQNRLERRREYHSSYGKSYYPKRAKNLDARPYYKTNIGRI